MSLDDDSEMLDDLGLSDDSYIDPDYVPSASSEKDDNVCPDSPVVSRSQRAEARQQQKNGKDLAITDARRTLMQERRKETKILDCKPRIKTSCQSDQVLQNSYQLRSYHEQP